MTTIANLRSFGSYAKEIMELRYSHVVNGRKESWEEIAERVCNNILVQGKVQYSSRIKPLVNLETYRAIFEAIRDRKFIPGGRILSQTGREYHQTDNCFLLRAEDTREGWGELAQKATMMFMSGGGVGVDYSLVRPYGSNLTRSGGISSGPIPLIKMINEIGAAARQGGERRGAIYASLKWDHGDIDEFIRMKMDGGLVHTNISTRFDKEWLRFVSNCGFDDFGLTNKAMKSFSDTLHHACKYGDPGFQFDWDDQVLRNACTEIISADDCDSCCLGSVNLARIGNLQELADVTQLGVIFLLAASMYTDIPYPKVKEVKERNRRIGLGFMGLGEWFIQRELPYGTISLQDEGYNDFSLRQWLGTWKQSSDYAADIWSKEFSVARPIAVRAVAPTGTISIAGGLTTPGIEPVFHTAYERTYNSLKEKQYDSGLKKERVIDPIVAKWIEEGYDVRDIDTAYTLSQTPDGIERRIALQAFVQSYVDNGISSTINLPTYEEGIESRIAPILLKYLPNLRGITFYPDGRHENQPVKPIDIEDVIKNDRVVMGEYESCKGDSCGV